MTISSVAIDHLVEDLRDKWRRRARRPAWPVGAVDVACTVPRYLNTPEFEYFEKVAPEIFKSCGSHFDTVLYKTLDLSLSERYDSRTGFRIAAKFEKSMTQLSHNIIGAVAQRRSPW